MDPMKPRPPRGHCPDLTADADRAAEEMLARALRRVLDRWAPLIVPAEPTDPPPATEPAAATELPTAATWLDNRPLSARTATVSGLTGTLLGPGRVRTPGQTTVGRPGGDPGARHETPGGSRR